MQSDENNRPIPATSALPSLRRLFLFAVLLPAAVAASSQLLLETASGALLYPWLTFTTAILSWCVGRYLQPAWLQWIVLAWCLALLDLLTIAACLGGGVQNHFAYVLISAQISLIALWAILAPVRWQWRLPGLLAAAPVVILFARYFNTGWRGYLRDWDVLMLLTAVVVILLCGSLRLLGFSLQRVNGGALALATHSDIRAHQFGLKHMLAWATALVPMLLVFRGIDFFVLNRLGAQGSFSLALVALSIATVDLIAIWAALGHGPLVIRLAVLLVVPFFLAVGTIQWMASVESMFRIRWRTLSRFDTLLGEIVDARETWLTWLWLNAALLAALLLFLRAKGYRLMRRRSST
ncbi:MAG: hypothetical protein L0228_12300 [Planctomycetes bacterium]|nr:hypothetical protein [Planctomycetota bacterium]